MNVGYVHTFEVPENNIDKGRLKVNVVNEENVPIKGAAVRLSYTCLLYTSPSPRDS